MTRLGLGFAILLGCSSPRSSTPWLADETLAFQRARQDHRAVLLDLTATWSAPSYEISRSLDGLRPEIDRDFVAVRIDVSNSTPRTEELRERYGVPVLPAVILVDTDGTVLARLVSTASEAELRDLIAAAASRRRR